MRRELLKIGEAAKYLTVSVTWLYDHCSGKAYPRVPVIRLGGCLRFDPEELDKFVDEMAAVGKGGR